MGVAFCVCGGAGTSAPLIPALDIHALKLLLQVDLRPSLRLITD